MKPREKPISLVVDETGFRVVMLDQMIGDVRWAEVRKIKAGIADDVVLVKFDTNDSGGGCNIDGECQGLSAVAMCMKRLFPSIPADWCQRIAATEVKGNWIELYTWEPPTKDERHSPATPDQLR